MTNRGRGDIRRLAAASAISGAGDWAASTALALAVYAKTGSAVWLSMSFLLTRIPSALVAPLSGIMADRLDRRRIMVTCDLLGAVAYAGMAVTSAPLPLIVLGSLAALLHAPFGPASRAAVPNLAGTADLSWANGTLSAASNVGQLAGPALGGVLYAAVGAGPAFWANAASFVASAGCIAVIRGRVFAAVGAVMTFASAASFGFAGFLVDAVGWRPVNLGGGLVDIACAVALALSLRWTPWRPAEPGRPAGPGRPAEPGPVPDPSTP